MTKMCNFSVMARLALMRMLILIGLTGGEGGSDTGGVEALVSVDPRSQRVKHCLARCFLCHTQALTGRLTQTRLTLLHQVRHVAGDLAYLIRRFAAMQL